MVSQQWHSHDAGHLTLTSNTSPARPSRFTTRALSARSSPPRANTSAIGKKAGAHTATPGGGITVTAPGMAGTEAGPAITVSVLHAAIHTFITGATFNASIKTQITIQQITIIPRGRDPQSFRAFGLTILPVDLCPWSGPKVSNGLDGNGS